EKLLLAQAQESDHVLDEEQLAFLADPSILDDQPAQTTITNNAAFQTEDLDAYDSDCDDVSTAQAVLMANLSNYGLDVISEVPYSEPYHNDMDKQSVHAMQDFEQTHVVDFPENEITSDSNIILYSQYLQETQKTAVQDTTLYTQQDSMILSVIEQMSKRMINHVNNWEKANPETNNKSLTDKLKRYKESNEYDGSVISSQHAVIPVIDEEETLILEEDKSCDNQNALEILEYFETNNLKAQLQAKDTTIHIEPISHRLKNNRDAYEDYLKKTIENTNTIRGLVERARKQNPSEPLLDSACMFTKHVQELCMFDAIHDMCVLDFVKDVNVRSKSAKSNKKQNIWKPTDKVFTEIGYRWKPTERTFTLAGHLVYYVEGLGHNLFSAGQFCDSDLEVAFQKTLASFGI
ncbi:hypothetical protein Tco_1368606, partial [Tanacetum coccineum]